MNSENALERTDNLEGKISKMRGVIKDLEEITQPSKMEYFSQCLNVMMASPNEETFDQMKNVMESLQPELCQVTEKLCDVDDENVLFENDNVVVNNPSESIISGVKNQLSGKLEESIKLQVEDIEENSLECNYDTLNQELAREIYHFNHVLDDCVDYLMQKL